MDTYVYTCVRTCGNIPIKSSTMLLSQPSSVRCQSRELSFVNRVTVKKNDWHIRQYLHHLRFGLETVECIGKKLWRIQLSRSRFWMDRIVHARMMGAPQLRLKLRLKDSATRKNALSLCYSWPSVSTEDCMCIIFLGLAQCVLRLAGRGHLWDRDA